MLTFSLVADGQPHSVAVHGFALLANGRFGQIHDGGQASYKGRVDGSHLLFEDVSIEDVVLSSPHGVGLMHQFRPQLAQPRLQISERRLLELGARDNEPCLSDEHGLYAVSDGEIWSLVGNESRHLGSALFFFEGSLEPAIVTGPRSRVSELAARVLEPTL